MIYLDFIFEKAKQVVINPNKAWQEIKAEETNITSLIKEYVLPFAILGALTSLIGNSFRYSFFTTLILAFVLFLIPIFDIIISNIIIKGILTLFKREIHKDMIAKLVVYSYTPILLSAIIASLHPLLYFLGFLGVYIVYLLWTGVPVMIEIDLKERAGFVVLSTFIIFATRIVLLILLIYLLFPKGVN